MIDSQVQESAVVRRPLWRRIAKWLGRCVAGLLLIAVAYVALLIAGLIPVNRDFTPTEDGIAIYVANNGVHTDIFVPATTSVFDWRSILLPEHFQRPTSDFRYVGLGWGDRDFYVNTPTWEDVSVVTTSRAMFIPTETIMHVQFGYVDPSNEVFRRVTLSVEQYERLVASLRASFESAADGSPIRLDVASYNSADCFYRGAGTYHALNTCNCWTGRMLRETGVKAGWFTPTPYSVLFHLPPTHIPRSASR